ncbi:hypothetical protein VTO73DRAFT_11629 [Trametes versicolor]
MQEARGRVAELTRRGLCTPDAGMLLTKYSSALDNIDNASYEARCEATDGAPETAVAVLVYAIQYGINSELARDIRRWTKLVAGIKSQLGQMRQFIAEPLQPSGPPSISQDSSSPHSMNNTDPLPHALQPSPPQPPRNVNVQLPTPDATRPSTPVNSPSPSPHSRDDMQLTTPPVSDASRPCSPAPSQLSRSRSGVLSSAAPPSRNAPLASSNGASMSDGYSSDDSDDSELNKATGIETSMGDSTIRQRGSAAKECPYCSEPFVRGDMRSEHMRICTRAPQ